MKRVLIVAYYFPPDGGAGTQRTLKFCKYLPHFDWQPIVVTRDARPGRSRWSPEDSGLLAEIGTQTEVIRVSNGDPCADWVADLPDIDVARPWLDAAYRACRLAIRNRRPDVILITMSPFDLAFLGRRLQAECDVPVIYDLRDPWALDGWRLHGSRARGRRDRAAMIDTLSGVDGVIANTPEAADALSHAMPSLKDRITTIPNGFDAADFLPPLAPAAQPVVDDVFRLVHVGTLHCETLYRYEGLLGRLRRMRHYRAEPIDTSGRTPFHLLRAVQNLRDENHPLIRRLRIVLIGPTDDETARCVRESGLADFVEITGYLSHSASIAYLLRADALFLPLHGLPAGRRSLIVPGKTYEYLASGRPILGCLPPGQARDLVEQSGRGFCADPCDPSEIAAALRRLYEAHATGAIEARALPTDLDPFERRALTERLAVFFERILRASAATRRHQPEKAAASDCVPAFSECGLTPVSDLRGN